LSPGPTVTPLLNGTCDNPDRMKALASTVVMERLGRPEEPAHSSQGFTLRGCTFVNDHVTSGCIPHR